MSTTSTLNDLTSRLRRRMETDRHRIEKTASRELERVREQVTHVTEYHGMFGTGPRGRWIRRSVAGNSDLGSRR